MKLETNLTIKGTTVEKIQSNFKEIEVYKQLQNNSDENVTLFFVENGEVTQSLTITADYGQNSGYISRILFEDMK